MTVATLDRASLLVPEGTRLLHIGPHKTGTTALQAALWGARGAMLEQGVHHAGKDRNPVSAVRAVTGQATSYSDQPPPMRDWRGLAHEITSAREPRLVVSSEFFAHADAESIARIAADLDASRLHIVVTLRPLAKIIPSMWQQNVQAGQRTSLDRWLHRLFPEPPARSNSQFWKLHRHDDLIARWAAVVGPDRVTAVVVDPRDQAFSLRVFEGMLGLHEGTLALEHDRANRSLTLSEAEAVRAFNVQFKRAGFSRALHARVMRFGAAQHLSLREPGRGELAINLPDWSLGRIAQVSAEVTDRIAASGVRVVGNLSDLTTPINDLARATPEREATEAAATEPVDASRAIAASLAMGVIIAAGMTHDGTIRGARVEPEAAASSIPSRLIAGAIGMRILATAVSRVQSLRARLGRVIDRRLAEIRARRSVRAGVGAGYGRDRPREHTGRRRMDDSNDLDPLLLPEGTLLLHIGPPKTGTTALQGAFHAARSAAAAQGVHYAGRSRHSVPAVQAVLGRPGFFTAEGPPSISIWRKLVDETRQSTAKRIVLSSEFFADANPELIRTVVDDLGADRIHVVVTLRPLARILSSQWQQYVQSNLRVSFDDWLEAMFNKEPGGTTPSFWFRHRHDRLTARWANVVGYDHMTVVALDENNHDFVLRVFERLSGLAPGTLKATPDLKNRSLTMPEVEAVRALNIAFKEEGLSRPLHSRVVNFGAARYMREAAPPADAPRVEAPQWALDRAGLVAREMIASIAATGVRVVGDLEPLAEVPVSRLAGDHQPPVTVPPSIAATMAMGVLYSSGLAKAPDATRASANGWNRAGRVAIRSEPIELVRMPTRGLVGVLVRRSRSSIRRRLPGGRTRGG